MSLQIFILEFNKCLKSILNDWKDINISSSQIFYSIQNINKQVNCTVEYDECITMPWFNVKDKLLHVQLQELSNCYSLLASKNITAFEALKNSLQLLYINLENKYLKVRYIYN